MFIKPNVLFLNHTKMTKSKRPSMDPSYFRKIRVGETHNFFYDSEKEEEVFYEKGKKKDSKVHFQGKDTLVIVGKEGETDMHIDMGSARRIVKNLHNHYATDYIKDLKDDVKKQFVTLHELIEAVSGTPAYEYLHEMITSEFRCADEHRFRIGTVGAYFCECQSSDDFPGNQSCSLGCLLGVHPEGGCKGYYPCEYTCVVYNGDETLNALHRVTDVDQAYLFVNDKFAFHGLTSSEVHQLQALGVNRVKVVKHSDGLSYQEVSADFIPVERLRLAHLYEPSTSVSHKKSSNSGVAVAVIVIVILLLLIFGGWYYYHNNDSFDFGDW